MKKKITLLLLMPLTLSVFACSNVEKEDKKENEKEKVATFPEKPKVDNEIKIKKYEEMTISEAIQVLETDKKLETLDYYDPKAFSADNENNKNEGECTLKEKIIKKRVINGEFDGCKLKKGVLVDLSKKQAYEISDKSDLGLNLVISLEEAWVRGAKNWPKKIKQEFLKDQENINLILNKKSQEEKSFFLKEKEIDCIKNNQKLHLMLKYGMKINQEEKALNEFKFFSEICSGEIIKNNNTDNLIKSVDIDFNKPIIKDDINEKKPEIKITKKENSVFDPTK